MFSRKENWLSWSWSRAEDYEFPESWHGKVYFLQCNAAPFCDRKNRPLQCRTFPLAPHLDENGKFYMIYHSGHLPYRCPLIDEEISLSESFLKATYTVWLHLLREPLIYDLIEMDSLQRIEDDEPLQILYPK